MTKQLNTSANPIYLENATETDDGLMSAADKTLLDNLVGQTGNLGIFNVKSAPYSAVGDGVSDDTAAIQAAVTAAGVAGGGIVYFPRSTYKTTSQLLVSSSYVQLFGDGPQSSLILFAPAADGVCIKFSAGASEILNNAIVGIRFNAADSGVYKKTAIQVVDASGFYLSDIWVDPRSGAGTWNGGGTGGSIGLQLMGREATTVTRFRAFTDQPIVVSVNPNISVVGCDHSHFSDIYIRTTPGIGGACVKVDDGVVITDMTFDGYQAWVVDKYGFYWSESTTTVVSEGVNLRNIRCEQAVDPTGYSIYVNNTKGIFGFQIDNLIAATGLGGVYAHGVNNFHDLTISNSTFATNNVGLNHVDLSGVINFFNSNNFWQINTGASLGGLVAMYSLPVTQSAQNLPPQAWYTDSTTAASKPLEFDGLTSFTAAVSVSADMRWTLAATIGGPSSASADTAGVAFVVIGGAAGTATASPGQAGGALVGRGGPGSASGGVQTAGQGGGSTWIGGTGGSGSGAVAGAQGGIGLTQGGTGGASSGATGTAGVGGGAQLIGGAAGAANGGTGANGGQTLIRGGLASGAGTNGVITIGDVNTSAIAIGASGITTTITGGLTQLTGAVSMTANAASSFTTSSGGLTLTAAAASTWSTAAGGLTITSAAAATWSSAAGALTITSAAAATWDTTGGTVKATTFETSSGVAMSIGTATATTISIGRSGQFVAFPGGSLRAATSAAGVAGVNMTFGRGDGGTSSGTGGAGGNGGSNTFTSGAGGTATTTASETAGTGGPNLVQGGQGGTGAASTNGPGNGGTMTVTGGPGGTVTSGFGGANGGNLRLRGGALTGSGTNGNVLIADSATAGISFFNVTAVAKQSSTGNTSYSDSGATTVHTAGTFTGGSGATAYTIGDIVLALKNYGLLTV